MNFPIDINAGQFLAFAALALATGVCFGISIGINIRDRYGRADRRVGPGRDGARPSRLADCVEVRQGSVATR